MLRRIVLSLVTVSLAGLFWTAPPAAAGGGCHQAQTDGTGDQVSMTQNCFVPTVARVAAGATVTWLSRDAAGHTVTGAGAQWGQGNLGPGASYQRTFEAEGTYVYSCLLHPGMIGAVVVGDGDGAGDGAGGGAQAAPPPAASSARESAATEQAASRASIDRAGDDTTGRWLLAGAALVVGAAGAGLRVSRSRRRVRLAA